ncbi:MAG: glycerophosphodiester phosphodiesterase family protein [Pseudomonadota bacterium]
MTLDPAFYTQPLAHRALHDAANGRPENSRAAIKAAIEADYGIEIDVQLSADGAAMVFHDYDLTRLTSRGGAVRLHNAAALSEFTLKGGSEGIPDLQEVLALVAGRVPLVVEIKDQDGAMGPNIGRLEAAVADALRGYAGPLSVMSFNPHSVRRMAELLPGVPRGLVTSAYRYCDWPLPPETCDHLREIPDYDRVGACFISHEVSDLSRARVRALKEKGAMICCWTVRSRAQEAEARAVADNITFEGYTAPHKA